MFLYSFKYIASFYYCVPEFGIQNNGEFWSNFWWDNIKFTLKHYFRCLNCPMQKEEEEEIGEDETSYIYDNEDNEHKEKGDSPKNQWDKCEWQRNCNITDSQTLCACVLVNGNRTWTVIMFCLIFWCPLKFSCYQDANRRQLQEELWMFTVWLWLSHLTETSLHVLYSILNIYYHRW